MTTLSAGQYYLTTVMELSGDCRQLLSLT